MTNKVLLEQRLKETNLTKSEIAKKLGLSRAGFYKKCTGERQFKQNEIIALMEILNIRSIKDINAIFFATNVGNN